MIEIIPNWHPVFVHFTIGLLLTAGLLFLAGYFMRHKTAGRKKAARTRLRKCQHTNMKTVPSASFQRAKIPGTVTTGR
jgi:uncharacterized membrane protein